jgi:calcineurin-like phosphoesterase family protein
MTGRVFFTADQHFGHKNIIEFCARPFEDVDHMNAALQDNWNRTVHPDDTVFVLGDFAMGKIDRTLQIVRRLNGTKFLVAGNHDRCWSPLRKSEQWAQTYLDAGFDDVINLLPGTTLSVGEDLVANHFPYQGDSQEGDRYQEWRPRDTGAVLLHGHVHTAWKWCTRQINVGVDVWDYRPVALDTIKKIMPFTRDPRVTIHDTEGELCG